MFKFGITVVSSLWLMTSFKEGALNSGHAFFLAHNFAMEIVLGSDDWPVESLTCLNKLSCYCVLDLLCVMSRLRQVMRHVVLWNSDDWSVDLLTCLNKYNHRISSHYLAYGNISHLGYVLLRWNIIIITIPDYVILRHSTQSIFKCFVLLIRC